MTCLPSVCHQDPLVTEISNVIEEWGSRILLKSSRNPFGSESQRSFSHAHVESICSLLPYRRQLIAFSSQPSSIDAEDATKREAQIALEPCQSLLGFCALDRLSEESGKGDGSEGRQFLQPNLYNLCCQRLRRVASLQEEEEEREREMNIIDELSSDWSGGRHEKSDLLVEKWVDWAISEFVKHFPDSKMLVGKGVSTARRKIISGSSNFFSHPSISSSSSSSETTSSGNLAASQGTIGNGGSGVSHLKVGSLERPFHGYFIYYYSLFVFVVIHFFIIICLVGRLEVKL